MRSTHWFVVGPLTLFVATPPNVTITVRWTKNVMTEAEQLSDLIGEICDAALDASLWVGALRKSAKFIDGSAAALFVRDALCKTGRAVYHFGIDPHYEQLYFNTHIGLNALTIGQVFTEIEEAIAVADIVGYEEFRETRAYWEWGPPQDIIDVVTVALDKTPTSAAMFCVFRRSQDGPVDDEARRRMRLIAPHVRRAVLIGRVFDLKAAEAGTFADALDGISAGMFLLDPDGRIVHANASGHAMLAEGDLLRAMSGRFVSLDGKADQALHKIFAAAGSGDAAVGVGGIAVPLMSRDGERYVAHVLPLTSGARRKAGTTYSAVAALFVHKAALDTPSPPEVIAKTFNLTPSELRVLLGIVEVGGVPETAMALGIGEATVKTHLHRVFAKTGTSRQAELVKLVAGFSNPLIG